jgi:nitrogen-specific signal transduction histidine kinase
MVDSKFAPAERSSIDEINDDIRHIRSSDDLIRIYDAVSSVSAILNQHRQVVHVNSGFLAMLGIDSIETVIGKRLGETVACINSDIEEGGCGTAEGCRYCGAIGSVLESATTGKPTQRETRLTVKSANGNVSLDLMVSVSPIMIGHRKYILITLKDIGDEKRLKNLEGIFFHDTINLAGGLNNAMKMLRALPDKNSGGEIITVSERVSEELLDDIISFRQIRQAENGDLTVELKACHLLEIVRHIVELLRLHESLKGIELLIDDQSVDLFVYTDRSILSRIILNMIKNALEASHRGDRVIVGVIQKNVNETRIWVNNKTVMTEEIKLQLFQRSFSTKGNNRGLGTYSIKLLGEQYLKGSVGFTSVESEGTTFYIDLLIDGGVKK